jgi:hypothetical protein
VTSNDTALRKRRRFSESAGAPQSEGSFWLADEWMRLWNVCVWDDEQASQLKPKLARDVQERFVSPSRARAHTSTLRFVRQVLEILADISCGEDHR